MSSLLHQRPFRNEQRETDRRFFFNGNKYFLRYRVGLRLGLGWESALLSMVRDALTS
jgi:hypothetical protein